MNFKFTKKNILIISSIVIVIILAITLPVVLIPLYKSKWYYQPTQEYLDKQASERQLNEINSYITSYKIKQYENSSLMNMINSKDKIDFINNYILTNPQLDLKELDKLNAMINALNVINTSATAAYKEDLIKTEVKSEPIVTKLMYPVITPK